MSLISQNVVKTKVKRKSKSKSKDDEGEETTLVNHVEEIVEDGDLNVDEGGIRKKKKKRSQEEVEAMKIEEQLEMEQLGSLLFGSLHSPVEFGKGGHDEVEINGGDDSALFVMDRSGNKDLSVYEDDGDARYVVGVNDEDGVKERRPVWVDDEEEEATVDISNVNRLRKLRKEEDERVISGSSYVARVRAQHAKLNPATKWAQLDSSKKGYDSDADSEVENGELVANGDRRSGDFDDILQTNEDVVVKRGAKLLPGILEYSRLVDANAEDPSNARINSVQFHRNHQLLLTAGHDKKLRFFQIDGKRNKMMDTIFFEDCPIFNASFLPDGSQVIVSGRRKFFYSVDISKGSVDKIGPLTGREEKSLEFFEVSPDSRTIAFVGNEGYILLVSSKTKELIGTLKMNGTVRSLAFSADGQKLLSSGGDGQIYHWDLRTRTCFHKGVDEGSLVGTALCTSPMGNLFASGSDSGIVNVYNRDEFLGGNRKPIKKIDNLTTKVHEMKFNHDAQILAICSRNGKSSLKLVHVPSFTVFSNWPPPNRSLSVPRCLDFSPAGGFMAIGNAAGKVQLYKLNHYQRA
ncbi:U3 small nucleolar RNA-associated protein 18 homolog [Silene latifolia]|uniref:U3 small nucleolar RNA-associated protein 18 homolog n=1 Tax=Silene latifolia TaxID=37657 RepID=UPI003D779B98